MRYEVTWMTWEYDFDLERDEQCFTSAQFDTFDKALKVYNEMKVDNNVEHVRLSVILDEYSRPTEDE